MPTQTHADELAEQSKRIVFEQHYTAFRALNQQMWQVPALAMTLTGGLWFGASRVIGDELMRAALLFLASVGDLAFMVALWRVRFIMGKILSKLEEMYPDYYVDASPGNSFISTPKLVVKLWSLVLFLSTIISIAFAGVAFYKGLYI